MRAVGKFRHWRPSITASCARAFASSSAVAAKTNGLNPPLAAASVAPAPPPESSGHFSGPNTSRAPANKRFVVKRNSSNCIRNNHAYKGDCQALDLSQYNEVLIDKDKLTAVVGGSISMEDLTDKCLAEGVLPAVVPEFRRITVGGAIMGAGLESSSGKWGQVNDCCNWYEVIDRRDGGSGLQVDGSLKTMRCSPSQNQDLFDGIPGSYGSLATLLTAEMQLVEAKKYVRLEYKWFPASSNGLQECLDLLSNENFVLGNDFVEGISYPGTKGHTVIVGNFTDEPTGMEDILSTSGDGSGNPWFFEHVMEKENDSSKSDLMLTHDYLHRYDRGAFWMAQPDGNFEKFKEHRAPLGALLHMLTSSTFRKMVPQVDSFFTTSKLFDVMHKYCSQRMLAEEFVIVDIYCDKLEAGKLIELCRERGHVCELPTPMWICPVRSPERPQFLSPHDMIGDPEGLHNKHNLDSRKRKILLDIGVWGRVQQRHKGIEAGKELEKWCMENNARKMFYSHNFFTKEQFWNVYDKIKYEQLRVKYGGNEQLVDIHDKVGDNEKKFGSAVQENYPFWHALAKLA